MNLQKLKSGKYMVIGDLLIDEFNYGTVTRLSPEAPIPILNHKNKEIFPGGAANVAMNLAGLGNDVELVGIVGDDKPGHWLIQYLNRNGIGTEGIVLVPSVPTIRKVRYSTIEQPLLRVDFENQTYDYNLYHDKIIKYIEKYLFHSEISGVLVSDYNKGLIPSKDKNNPFEEVFDKICNNEILCGADTKKYDSALGIFSGFNFMKPNKVELSKATNKDLNTLERVREASLEYLKASSAKAIFVTLGEEGIYYYGDNNEVQERAYKTKVLDVTGAGDTVFAVIMNARGSGFSISDAMKLANIAASIVIETKGTKAITKSELIGRVNSLGGK